MAARRDGDELPPRVIAPSIEALPIASFPVSNDVIMTPPPEGNGVDQRQVGRVRELLREMLASDAWGEKDRAEWEQSKLMELRKCVLEDGALEELQRLPKRMCAYEFKPGDIAWNCKACQVDETCVMCNDCFIASDHDGHEVFFYYTHSGGCCDCGDPEAWAPEGFCTHHRGAQDVDPLLFYPPGLVIDSRASLTEVLRLVLQTITEARSTAIIHNSDVERVRATLAFEPPERRYSVIVHYNELQSSQEFASGLTRALPAISYQTLKIVGEASTQKQSLVRSKATREEALEVAEALNRNGLIASIVSSDYKAKTPVVSALLQWLVSLANLSDGLCRLICEQFIAHTELSHSHFDMAQLDPTTGTEEYPVLRAVILADSFLPKGESDALHSLLMSLLADPTFKKAFAIAFTSCYRQLYREFIAGVGSSSLTILTFSVQFFNRASFVKLLVANHELLEVLVASVLETLRRKPRRIPIDDSYDDSSDDMLALFGDSQTVDIWDLFALGIQRSCSTSNYKLWGVNVPALEAEAASAGYSVRKPMSISAFLSLPPNTDLPGRFELDVSSPVFAFRRYMSGLLDLRYALQIEGISECFVLDKNGARLADFLLYLAYIQGVCAETRRFGDHVEMESRAWVVTVEFVSTASDVFTWIITNVFKNIGDQTSSDRLYSLIANLTKTILEAYYFWLASAGKYFPSTDYEIGQTLGAHPVDTPVSCHFPLHRALAQLIRTLCDSETGLKMFFELVLATGDKRLWVHDQNNAIGFWHRALLIEPALQAIVWDAEVHSGLWVRNGMSVVNHSMNYGEPPFCLRFRDLDLLLLQFGFRLLGIDWMVGSIVERFGVLEWYDVSNTDIRESELIATECMTLLCQFASELPPRISEKDPLRSLMPYLRRAIVQRLIVGACAHSDLSKVVTEFFQVHENLLSTSISTAPVLDQILKEVCVGPNSAVSNGSLADFGGGGKVQYRLKPELYAEYNPTSINLTRKQHEAAHENWFQHRVRLSKSKEQQAEDVDTSDLTHSSWLDFPIVNSVLPCAPGFQLSRLSILHDHARKLVYEALWRASTDAHSSLSVLSRAVHLFTLQIYVVEEVRYIQTASTTLHTNDGYQEESAALLESYICWVTTQQPSLYSVTEPRASPLQLLLKLNPWMLSSGGLKVNLDGDQKHEIGRGIDWLVHRLTRNSAHCKRIVDEHRMNQEASREDEERKALLIRRRKEAQVRAIQQMQQRQAAFAEQMKAMMSADGASEDDDDMIDENGPQFIGRDSKNPTAPTVNQDGEIDANDDVHMEDTNKEAWPECAMCHSVESENSFMCYVGFAQCSPVFSRLNGGFHGRYLSTPMDEMHVGEDVPVHVRLCGHSVHQTCWESYHASQFQRAITGGHHRHALNAVDVTKKEFLCPLCKSISNVLIPTTPDDMDQLLTSATNQSKSIADMHSWLDMIGRGRSSETFENDDVDLDGRTSDLEQKPLQPLSVSAAVNERGELSPHMQKWLEEGLSSLCMAIHKVACGATQKSRPDRFAASGCLALFHTLLCTFVGSTERDQLQPEQRFFRAMRFVPLMLQHLPRPRFAIGSNATESLSLQIPRLLYYGGSEILPDGSILLEDEHPSTQTQTRKQSQWGKVRWPTKPLMLSQLGSVLVKGILLSSSESDAIYIARLVVLARVVQSLLWYSITCDEEFTDGMAHELEYSDENVEFFVSTLFDGDNRNEASAIQCIEALRSLVVDQCAEVFSLKNTQGADRKLLNVVAADVVPLMKVAAFLCKSRYGQTSSSPLKPVLLSQADAAEVGFVALDSLWSENSTLQLLVTRWVHRFKDAYTEMNDPQGVLQQWLTSANVSRSVTTKLNFPAVLARDLNTMHTSLSVFTSGSNRTRYLRSLPRAYVKFYADLAKRKCSACNQFPARPAVCLVCGMLLCAANTCPSIHLDKGLMEETNPGACTVHAKKCGRGSCMFLLVLEGAVLLVYWKLAAYVGSLYVDEYGEEFGERNRELNKGRPLYLNTERRDRLLRLWQHHEIPNEVVRIQNSSDRVIRNSHY
ncbi:hypothetical protein Poli38472_003086 [Pythium oligandrum]|uniref:E3 ubiquitin-protein ligase n=1 Tax=Pythium oligandrum TaxID=41045 RepID=A0A8K1C667_PYTOL|nr:hypothetical protein Poli38472_003086 [Pythium oligandrum]|eukprot:TMW57161.1 hypothetical protein Poli38472_003086 [Pythium oligandrum]